MRNVLNVFIASPSDLRAERERAFRLVAEINDTLRPINWSIELLGWEDTLPGYGRPQALINKDVERCDLFVGMVWRRWGTPPGHDSTFSSGFEEEFEIAKRRREQSLAPEIWMFFKRVDVAQIADAGAQLQRVISFRDSLIAGKSVLFKEFETADDWEKMLRSYLTRHVLELTGTPSNVPEGPSVPPVQPAPAASNTPAAGEQLSALAGSLVPAFATGDLEEVTKELSDDDATFIAVRTMLLSAALVAASRTSASLLPTHELNTLYRYRQRLHATQDELFVIFRTLLSNSSGVTPGWYWLTAFDTGAVLGRLWRVFLYDDDVTARSTSLDLFRSAGVRIPAVLRTTFLSDTLPGLPREVRDSAWAYLVRSRRPRRPLGTGEGRGHLASSETPMAPLVARE